jgi:hypothetical protein
MKQTFFSTVLAAALTLGGVGIATAAPQHGGVHGGVQAMPRGSVQHGPAFRGNVGHEHFEHHGGGVVIAPFYGGWYDPYWYGWGSPYYYGGYVVSTSGIRLDVKPHSGEVYVDGNYAGPVSDFNGVFQSLDLTPGGHQIDIRTPGYQTLTFTTYIQPGHVTHYKARLVPGS